MEWKRTKDKARQSAANAANSGEGSIDSSTTFTGVCNLTLRTMSEVEQYPLCIGHSFPTNDRVLLRIAEEANLFGVRIKIKRSNSHQIHVYGVNDDFYVRAIYGDTHRRWTVTSDSSSSSISSSFLSSWRMPALIRARRGGSSSSLSTPLPLVTRVSAVGSAGGERLLLPPRPSSFPPPVSKEGDDEGRTNRNRNCRRRLHRRVASVDRISRGATPRPGIASAYPPSSPPSSTPPATPSSYPPVPSWPSRGTNGRRHRH
jgi:hypothetical protein